MADPQNPKGETTNQVDPEQNNPTPGADGQGDQGDDLGDFSDPKKAYEEIKKLRSENAKHRNSNKDLKSKYEEMNGKLDALKKLFGGETEQVDPAVEAQKLKEQNELLQLRGMQQLWGEGQGAIPDLKKTLFHRMDKRTGKDSKWLAQHNPIVPIDEPFVESSLGHEVSYMAPPNRPNDRAILIPYRDGWKN